MSKRSSNSNHVGFPGPLIPWGQPVSLTIGAPSSPSDCMDMSSARFVLTCQAVFTGVTPPVDFKICKPAIAWIKQYTLVTTYHDGSGKTKAVSTTGYPGRGDAGFLYSLMDRSSGQTVDVSYPECISRQSGVAFNTFEVTIPVRYLIDPFCTTRFLSISNIMFNPTFDQFLNIFSPPTGGTLSINVIGYHLDYMSYKLDSLSSGLRYPDPRITFMQASTVQAGETAITQIINVPGKLIRVFYYFLVDKASAADGTSANPYSFNPHPNAVVTQHQITCSGKAFPLSSSYAATSSPTSSTGLSRHYYELLSNINKLTPNANTILSYEMYRDNYRIYSIEVDDKDLQYQSSVTLQINLCNPTIVTSNLVMINQYLPYTAEKNIL
jgi:hypothetical protein